MLCVCVCVRWRRNLAPASSGVRLGWRRAILWRGTDLLARGLRANCTDAHRWGLRQRCLRGWWRGHPPLGGITASLRCWLPAVHDCARRSVCTMSRQQSARWCPPGTLLGSGRISRASLAPALSRATSVARDSFYRVSWLAGALLRRTLLRRTLHMRPFATLKFTRRGPLRLSVVVAPPSLLPTLRLFSF